MTAGALLRAAGRSFASTQSTRLAVAAHQVRLTVTNSFDSRSAKRRDARYFLTNALSGVAFRGVSPRLERARAADAVARHRRSPRSRSPVLVRAFVPIHETRTPSRYRVRQTSWLPALVRRRHD
jgi:hypothetical protein